MRNRLPQRHCRSAGVAYTEVLVALVLVMVALVPALEALRPGVMASRVLASVAARDATLRAKMEEVLAKPFSVLDAETQLAGGNTTTSVSAALSDGAGPERRIVILYRTDGTALSGADTGLLRVRVAFEAGGSALETLRSKWW